MEDDEIVVSVNLKEEPNKKKKKVKKTKDKKTKVRTSKTIRKKSQNKKLKVISIIILIIVCTVLLLMSSLFNVKNINIDGNEKLSDDKIVSLSSIQLYTNIFKFNKKEIINNIKKNAYIETVSLSRKLPNTVNITVNERKINYMLQFADSYVYINNQGYMLEISNEKVPILVGFTTDLSNIKAGNRINDEDLGKMNTIIKVYEMAKSNNLSELISKIDISDSKNYIMELESKGKIVYLGDCSNTSDLNTKMLYLSSILDASEGKKEKIFLNVDLNSQRVYSRPITQ